ncbi:cytidylate kinase family protein [Dehalobacterium formicoaceticum]|uniref:cytidylate kinase family protein n=1 Tax=Dehalobacterium formicoaceticum TaxID=51515 RepID=UPI003B83A39A
MKLHFITISRQTGSLGEEITELLAKKLDLPVISRDMVMNQWLPEVANSHELHMLAESPGFYLNMTEQGITFAQYLEQKLADFIEKQPSIIVGLGAQIIFAQHPSALHVRIIASQEVRTKRIMVSHSLEKKDAERFLELSDRKHKRYISTLYQKDWSDPGLYNLTLNTDDFQIDEAASLLHYLAINKQDALIPGEQEEGQASKPIIFKHPSEEEFAKILNMYNLDWEYEPRTFPIEWDAEGNVKMAFSPDFYLTKYDTYIELTTMNQKYVSEKKKKVALLKKLYPGTNINIVFKNDYYTLLKRFGLQKGVEEK